MSDESYSTVFERLAPAMQRWIWRQGWEQLRPTQEAAAPLILAGDSDVLISAATAAGKTEAAFLPALSNAVSALARGESPLLLYVAPLKALINDQRFRLEGMLEGVDLMLTPWHGDVGETARKRFRAQPGGVLLITPESLEAFFVHQGNRLLTFFGGVQHVIVDELHAFPGSERGRQLQSLLDRLELVVGRRIPRIGLSATMGNLELAAEYLRPHDGSSVAIIKADEGEQALRVQLRGYEHTPARLSEKEAIAIEATGSEVAIEDVTDGDTLAVRDDLFRVLRGSNHLVFANARHTVELFADLLRRKCQSEKVPQEFFPHHGSLSKQLRQDTEARLKEGLKPTTAICTSTLEMGIDIGSVESIAQIGAPYQVSALRQRLGRSGRRGEPAVLRIYINEDAITPQTPLLDRLRGELFQATAMVELLLQGWCEAPRAGRLHLSTCLQQVLSLICQYGGVTARDLWRALAERGPFGRTLTKPMLVELLRVMGEHDLIIQADDGLLLHGERGEQIVNHYDFYVTFPTSEEFTLYYKGRPMGMLPIDGPLAVGQLLIFAGRRWRVDEIDPTAKAIMLSPSSGGTPPLFSGAGGQVDGKVREAMRTLYLSGIAPRYLSRGAKLLFEQGVASFRTHELGSIPVILDGEQLLCLPWAADRVIDTLALALLRQGIGATREQFALAIQSRDVDRVRDALVAFINAPPASAEVLAELVPTQVQEKYDPYLPPELLNADYAARALDLPGALRIAEELLPAFKAVIPQAQGKPENV
ncbi:DEAD/DEAH box helicase [Methylonatrum kenyense]|uniref:DEAD/DEAH box helicase n=1 Tax=Methylonatrum kenyense TaxID=455253 RepID=UPI0020C11746|nr:DEAD/DEAH box helicase [Methylonatrum kenyense]MCK8515857.1 DEAD/DEAH box helicase [Methylonatrum kenyense]